MKAPPPYQHHKYLHNTSDPEKIVPVIMDLIKPQSVVDIGCGLATFLKVFKDHGVHNVLGIDGEWVNRLDLYENISEDEFMEFDLNQKLLLDKKYELVISLEVAEHLPLSRASSFVDDLIKAGKVILFSAAVPGQKGTNHINEQWLSFWGNEFARHDYLIHDILKDFFWNDSSMNWWYKQNMVLITPENFKFNHPVLLHYNRLRNVIHPDLFSDRTHKFDKLSMGKMRPAYYLKLFLKSVLNLIFSQKNNENQ